MAEIPATDIPIGEALRWIKKMRMLTSEGAQVMHLRGLLRRIIHAENEACAQIADMEANDPHGSSPACAAAEGIAAEIRARSDTPKQGDSGLRGKHPYIAADDRCATCPHCHKPLTEAQIRRIWASYTGSKQTPHAGPGRPRTERRCPCGEMTLKRAKQRGHKC